MPRPLARFAAVVPVASAGQAAAVYVPLLLATRALAFVRLLAVAWLLGEAGKREFGLYPPALELINLLVPLVLLGLSDVAERYAAQFERQGQLRKWLRRQVRRLLPQGLALWCLLAAVSPWAWRWLASGPTRLLAPGYAAGLLLAVGGNVLVLALYQWLAAVLRGLRAYPAAAAMETTAAVLLLGLSAVGALQGTALALLVAYAASNALPLAWYALALRRFLRLGAPPAARSATAPAEAPPRVRRFAWFAWLRLWLVMAFGFVSTWGLLYLVRARPAGLDTSADFGMAYRIAQLLAYLGAASWASGYGIAARAWAHGARRRALVTMLTVGRVGGALVLLLAALLTLGRGLLAHLVHASYVPSLHELLPPMLALFAWYALLGLLARVGDLEERPWIGAAAWGVATLTQALVIVVPPWLGLTLATSPTLHVVAAGGTGLGAGLIVALLLLWPARRRARLGGAIVLLALAAGLLFVPDAYVVWAAWAAGAAAVAIIALGRRRSAPWRGLRRRTRDSARARL